MLNFEFYSPTKFIFGQGQENQAGALCKQHGASKVLLHFGGGSVVKSGLLERVKKSLEAAGVSYVELGGVQPNPRLTLAKEGIELCRKEGVDFILAVGGGSAIDSAKCIAVGVCDDGDVWDFYTGKRSFDKALPVATVLTIAAAGSEGSPSSVITNEAEENKTGIKSDLIRPVFSILNPELTYTLPDYQKACGATDMFLHIVERYFTNTPDVYLTDELCEATMRTIVKYGPQMLANAQDYNAHAQIMWAGMIAHNNLLGVDREQDWASHGIQAPIGAKYDSAHGAGLACVCPAWMKYVYKQDVARFVRFATNVWGIENDVFDPEGTALKGIEATKQFFKSLGMPVTLAELGVKESDIDHLVNMRPETGFFVKLKANDLKAIYELMK